MIEIVATKQGGSIRTSLDAPDTPVEFNFSISDARDITVRRSPHSLRFSMPASKTNNKFFSHYHEVNFGDGTFNAQKKTQVEVYDSGIVVLRGALQLHSVHETNGTYEVSILGEAADFFDAVRDLEFEDLFINSDGTINTDLDHALNGTNIVDSWTISNDITSGSVGAGVVVYPLSDWGPSIMIDEEIYNGFVFSQYSASQNFHGMGHSYTEIVQFSKPAILVSWLFEKILQKAGYTYNSTFFGSIEFRNLFMFLATDKERVVGRATYGMKVGRTVDEIFPTTTATTWSESGFWPMVLQNETTNGFFDPDNVWADNIYTAPFDGVFAIKLKAVLTTSGTTTTPPAGAYPYMYSWGFTALVNDASGTVYNSQLQQCPYGQEAEVTTTFTFSLSAGQTLTFYTGGYAPLQDVTLKAQGSNDVSYAKLMPYESSSVFVDMSQNFPKMKIGDWLKEIINRFNLVIYTNPDNPTVLNIEPYNDFIDASSVKKDWTKKVDVDTIQIEPTTTFQKKKVLFSDGEGLDWRNDAWQKHWGWVKGRYKYDNDNDFVTEEQKIGGLFQPLRLDTIPSGIHNQPTIIPNVLVPRLYDVGWDGQGVKDIVDAKPILAHYLGPQFIGNGGTFILGPQTTTKYPYFSEYTETPVTSSTNCIHWGYDWPDNIDHPLINDGTTAGATLEYCYRHYWARFMHELYSTDSRVMTCQAYLTPYDINALVWNDEIFLENAYWRVLKISNYSTGGNTPSNLQLIKVIGGSNFNSTEECSSQPITFNTNGTVNFADIHTGAAVLPTEPCCTEAGYIWDSTNNLCFYLGTGGDVGGNPDTDSTVGLGGDTNLGDTIIGPVLSSKAKAFNSGGVLGSTQKFDMQLQTTDAVVTSAKLASGQTDMSLLKNCIYLITVDAITVETGGSLGTVGKSQTMRYQGALKNIGANAEKVGATTLINSNGDTGANRTLVISQTQSSANAPATFSIDCTGEADKAVTWFIEVTMVQTSVLSTLLRDSALWDLAPDTDLYLNLSYDDLMRFN